LNAAAGRRFSGFLRRGARSRRRGRPR
jgi:hypothetical protein